MSMATLLKMTRGSASQDEVLEMLSAFGVEMEIQPIDQASKQAAIDQTANLTLPEGSKATALCGTLTGGQSFFAILVLPG